MNDIERFCRDNIHKYFETGDLSMFGEYLSDNSSVIGTGKNEYFTDRAELLSRLKRRENPNESVCFTISAEEYHSIELCGGIWLVTAAITISQKGTQATLDVPSRLTVVLKKTGGEYSVIHMHHSVPDENQAAGDFFRDGVTARINHMLEEKIAEKTRELREANDRLRIMAEHDHLSGVFNRAYFEKIAEKLMSDALHKGDLFMIIDIDKFKQCNDMYGHQAGDGVISDVGGWLIKEFPDGICARLGGDEFAMFINCSEDDDNFILRVNEAVKRLYERPSIKKYNITVSLGASHRQQSDSFPKLYSRADKALYKAKETRDCFVLE